MNQIVSSVLTSQIIGNLVNHTPITFQYLFDKLPKNFCQYDFFIRNCLATQMLLLGLAFIIVRYIYVFHAANITAIQDDFWICFLNIWTLGFCSIAYLVVFQVTGKRPRHFYFCLGKIPNKSQSDGPFVNYIFNIFFIRIILTLLIVGIRYRIRDCQSKNNHDQPMAVAKQGYLFRELVKANLLTFVECVVGAIIVFVTVVIPVYQIERRDWTSLSTYPGYLWVYVFHLYQPQTVKILIVFFAFGKNKKLRNFAIRIINEKFAC